MSSSNCDYRKSDGQIRCNSQAPSLSTAFHNTGMSPALNAAIMARISDEEISTLRELAVTGDTIDEIGDKAIRGALSEICKSLTEGRPLVGIDPENDWVRCVFDPITLTGRTDVVTLITD
ncbi:hypothetical protein [Dinoroseobacter sp. S76]|uniref:hypothetical protein n=1 Tax=Dinoroseobacter sp. S76 TaxID=3415124 RepID=UPI003C7CF58E